MASGHVEVLLNGGGWNGKTPEPTADAIFSNLDLVLSGGVFALNNSSLISVRDGSTISAQQLQWRAAQPGLAGPLNALDLKLQLPSPINLPSGFQVAANSDAEIAMIPEQPVVLNAGGYPSGGFTLDGSFSAFRDQSKPSFGLTNGRVHLVVSSTSDGSYSIDKSSTFSGLMTLVSGPLTMTWDLRAHDISGERKSGAPFQGNGLITATIGPGWSIPVTTPAIYHTPGHDDMRIYPVNMTITSKAATNIPDTPVDFGASFTLASQANPTKVNLPLVIGILPGNGEHQQPDDQESSADGTHGPDQDKHRQEVFTDTYPGCRAHLYVIPGDYNLTASLSFAAYQQGSGRVFHVGVDNIDLQQDVGFDRDGCSLSGILSGIFGVIGFITGGPVGGVVGFAIGHFAGNRVDDVIDSRIESSVRDYLDTRNGSWTIALP